MSNFAKKLIIFDLDGVLVDSKDLHYESLNLALKECDLKYTISLEEHLSIYDGLPTNKKLIKLNELKGLPKSKFDQIWRNKQKQTLKLLNQRLELDNDLVKYFKKLIDNNFLIVVASNSISETVNLILDKIGVLNLISFYLSNEDVENPKPHPEIFWKCMSRLNFYPSDTFIVEDSHHGRVAASQSGAKLIGVSSRKDIDEDFIDRIIAMQENLNTKKMPWESKELNILIPMAGSGSRFQAQGYTFPKPLIEVKGKPMIQVVVDNLNVKANYIFIVQKKHYEEYSLNLLLPLISKNCSIIQVEGVTEGAACTTLLAKDLINNDKPLMMANSDQFIEWDSSDFLYTHLNDSSDGSIVTFEATHPKWSYAKLDESGYVSEVAEKKPISTNATAGIYLWKKGSDYVKYAEDMIKKNIRVNNEFYVCPVFNEAIQDGKKIRTFEIEKTGMWGLGTPEDLNYFIENYKGNI